MVKTHVWSVEDELLERWIASGKNIAAVVGVAKNVGKTSVVAKLTAACTRRELVCALLSVGRDGERFDALSDRPKPPVILQPGMLAVTTRHMLGTLSRVELLAALPVQSAVGELVLVRAHERQQLEIFGPRFASDIARILEIVKTFHTGPVLIDGALDRLTGLAGADAACIVATGAIVDRRMEAAVARTETLAARLRLPPASEHRDFVHLDGPCDELVAARVLNERLPGIIVRDPTMISAGAFAALRGRVAVRRPFTVLACTVNSVAPQWSFDADEFLRLTGARTALWSCDCFRGTVAP